MKIPYLISIAALMVATTARSEDASVASVLSVSYTDPSMSLDDIGIPRVNHDEEIIDMPLNDLPVDDKDVDSSHDKSSRVVVWSSPGYKGHKQVTKGTRGCYRLDGGAVGSFEGGLRSSKYGFFKDDRCRGKQIYGWTTAPVHRIDPIIYPRSLKIYENGGGPEPPRPEPKYSLVAWSGSSFSGKVQLISGMGCRLLTGDTIASFQGEYRYKFFAEPYCYGRKTLESDGGKSSVRKMNPRSVYIY